MLGGFQKGMPWLNRNYDELKENYPELYVAVYNKTVVDQTSVTLWLGWKRDIPVKADR